MEFFVVFLKVLLLSIVCAQGNLSCESSETITTSSENPGEFTRSESEAWFDVTGTGEVITASTCNARSEYSRITVFSGPCDDLKELDVYDECFSVFGSSMSWVGQSGVEYFLIVNAEGTKSKHFFLEMSSESMVANRVCTGAVMLSVPQNVRQKAVSYAYDELSDSGRLWYRVIGDGNVFSMTSCTEIDCRSNDNRMVSIYRGDCSSLEFIGNRRIACVPESPDNTWIWHRETAEWIAEVGVEYYLGFWTDERFEFDISSMEPKENDICSSAQGLTIPSSTVDSTHHATDDDELCREHIVNGVWFKVVGNGLFVTASTCSHQSEVETFVLIMDGSCDNLRCVAEMSEEFECKRGGGHEATWIALEGEVYYVLVYTDLVEGSFELTLTSSDFREDAPENDVCARSMPVDVPSVTLTSTRTGTSDPDHCTGSSHHSGIWFSVVGNGDVITAGTANCDPWSSVDVVLHYDCNTPECELDGVNNCPVEPEGVSWLSEENVQYYVLVSAGDVDFEFHVSTSPAPLNSDCQNPIQISSSETVLGSNTGAPNVDLSDETCEFSTFYGTWYSIRGNGEVLSVICDIFGYFHVISVFKNDCTCSALVFHEEYDCVAVWPSGVGEEYLVLVSSWDLQNGDYAFEVSSNPGPENDKCENAVPLEIPGITVGSLAYATRERADDFKYSDVYPDIDEIYTIWYTFIGTGEALTVDFCSDTWEPWDIVIFTGDDCQELEQVFESRSCSSNIFVGRIDVEYYLIVYDLDPVDVDTIFELRVSSNIAVPNDLCGGAQLITTFETIDTSSAGATHEDGFDPSGSVWYSIEGTGEGFSLSCDPEEKRALDIGVYTGDCGGLDLFTFTSSCPLRWFSDLNVLYIIRFVPRFEDTFSWQISTEALPDNADCTTSKLVEIPSVTPGTTHLKFGRAMLWYSVIGTGGTILASTCGTDDDTSLDSRIDVQVGCDYPFYVLEGEFKDTQRCEEVWWNSEEGIEYKIKIYERNDLFQRTGFEDAGFFELTVLDVEPPENEDCANAIAVSTPTTVRGTSIGAKVSEEACDYTKHGVWYLLGGVDEFASINFCGHGSTDEHTKIEILHGECGLLESVEATTEACETGRGLEGDISFFSELDKMYYVFVMSREFTIKFA